MKSMVMGMLGGGQLGRMTAMAAARLGIRTHVFCPETDTPAFDVAYARTVAAYDDRTALKHFAKSVDIVTYEFENVPVDTVRFLQKHVPVWPDDRLLHVAQHRCREKQFLNDLGIPTTTWRAVHTEDDLRQALHDLNPRGIIVKTARMGYDGKGQMILKAGMNPLDVFTHLRSNDLIAEAPVRFTQEISALIARDQQGQSALYTLAGNDHRDHVLAKTTVPAVLPPRLAARASTYAQTLADAVGLVGVLALELFVTHDNQLLANEIAPRPHNSGHWTIDACAVSQFEQHARTVCGLPVGNPHRHSDAVMINVLGDEIKKIDRYLSMKNACVHLYGKKEASSGRKMGHITLLKPLR